MLPSHVRCGRNQHKEMYGQNGLVLDSVRLRIGTPNIQYTKSSLACTRARRDVCVISFINFPKNIYYLQYTIVYFP